MPPEISIGSETCKLNQIDSFLPDDPEIEDVAKEWDVGLLKAEVLKIMYAKHL